MNKYEGIFIFNAELTADALADLTTTVSEIITKEGGEVTETVEWGRRRLAYLIDKAYEGHYVLLRFQLSPDKLARINSLFRLNEKIIKQMIVRFEDYMNVQPPAPRENAEGAENQEEVVAEQTA